MTFASPILSKKILHWLVSCTLVLSFAVISYSPSVFPAKVERAEAWSDVPAIAQRALLFVQQWVVDAAMELYQHYIYYKEKYLDPMAWLLGNVILEQMTQEIIKWINSGFEGRPAFVQNPKAYFTNIADKVVGDTIWGSDFKFLCSPFALDIKLALELQYVNGRGPDYQYTSQCTLSNVIDNVQGFFDGDFLSSGWEGWMEVTTKPQNNPYGALALGSMHLSAQIGSKQEEKSQALAWGRGLMSSEICEEYVVEDGDGTYEVCNTVTPGAAIQDQLSKVLSIPAERLTVSDEFNEILNALFNQLVIKAFSEVGGLLGTTESNISGAPGTGTYYQDLEDSSIKETSSDEIDSFRESIQLENRFLARISEVLLMIDDAANYKNNTYGASACHSGELNAPLLAAKAKLETLSAEIRITITRLEAMISEYTALATDPSLTSQQRITAQMVINQEYTRMLSRGEIHRETNIATFNVQDSKQIEEAIINYKAEVDAACIYYGGTGGA